MITTLIQLARLAYLLVWLFLLINLLFPYPKPAQVIANIALITLAVLHGLQSIMLRLTLTPEEKKQNKLNLIRLFLFGAVEILYLNNIKNKR